jgi:hypothetical protein
MKSMNWSYQKATEDKKRRRDLARTDVYIQLMNQACTMHIMLGSRFIYIWKICMYKDASLYIPTHTL